MPNDDGLACKRRVFVIRVTGQCEEDHDRTERQCEGSRTKVFGTWTRAWCHPSHDDGKVRNVNY
jgi:hypothetical protein